MHTEIWRQAAVLRRWPQLDAHLWASPTDALGTCAWRGPDSPVVRVRRTAHAMHTHFHSALLPPSIHMNSYMQRYSEWQSTQVMQSKSSYKFTLNNSLHLHQNSVWKNKKISFYSVNYGTVYRWNAIANRIQSAQLIETICIHMKRFTCAFDNCAFGKSWPLVLYWPPDVISKHPSHKKAIGSKPNLIIKCPSNVLQIVWLREVCAIHMYAVPQFSNDCTPDGKAHVPVA